MFAGEADGFGLHDRAFVDPRCAIITPEHIAAEQADAHLIVEGSQGTLLSLALSNDYPYVTSDSCTATAAMDDVGLSWRHATDVVMVVKAMPSRVGQGPLPHEISWAQAQARGIAEYGVVTGRPRRKAEVVDHDLLRDAAMLNGPTQIALTFCDHYARNSASVRS